MSASPRFALAAAIFLPFALAYLLSFLMRVVNAVAGPPIMAELSLSPSDLGLLTSVYLAGFALFQLPLGVMVDRYGARRVEAATLLLAVAGTLLFAIADTLVELIVARFFIGVGLSLCLMAPITAYRAWFPPGTLPLITGLHMTFGAVGSALGGFPAELMLEALGWRGLFMGLAALIFVAAVGIVLIVPARRELKETKPLGAMGRDLVTIAKSRALWRIAPLSGTAQAGYLSVAGLWMGPFLRDAGGLSADAAGAWLSAVALGLIVGFFGYGFVVGRATTAAAGERVFVVGSALAVAVGVFLILVPPAATGPLWVIYAALTSGGVVTYAQLNARFADGLAGRVNAMLNFIVFFVAFVVQWGFGVIVAAFPPEEAVLAHRTALGVLAAIQLASFLPLVLKSR
ncbi:MAG: MFS transporter [Pseudomonadota bacterium]